MRLKKRANWQRSDLPSRGHHPPPDSHNVRIWGQTFTSLKEHVILS
jgi:hypothetical protein